MSKIDAIKAVRARLKVSLKDAKEVVDEIAPMVADWRPLDIDEQETLRDRFAMSVMSGMLASPRLCEATFSIMVKQAGYEEFSDFHADSAYKLADAMLEARKK